MDRFIPLIEQFGVDIKGPDSGQRRAAFAGQAQRFGAEGRIITRPFRGRGLFHGFRKLPPFLSWFIRPPQAQGIVFKRRFFGLHPLSVRWQATDAVALQATVQRQATQVRDSFLERVEAIIEGQQGLLAKQNDGRFFSQREHGGGGFEAAHGLFLRGTATPLDHRFGVDTETGG